MIDVLVMTDGRRDCITETIASARDNLYGPIDAWWIHDDSGDPDYRDWLETFRLPIIGGATRSGFGGAIRSAWRHLRTSDARFVFHLEDDFTFNRPVDLAAMADVLDANPHLVQLALRRQPWNAAEVAAGGFIEQHPDAYIDRTDGEHEWLEHTGFFTTNPSLYRRSLLDEGWPDGDQSEGRFALNMMQRHPGWRFGYWGGRNSGEAVTHIGNVRSGVGY